MGEDLFGNEVTDLPLKPKTSERITNDMRQVIEVLGRACSDAGYLIHLTRKRVYRHPEKDIYRSIPLWEQGVVLQLMASGHLRHGGQHAVRSGSVRQTLNSILPTSKARSDLSRWRALKTPASWPAAV